MAELKCPHCGQAFTVDDTELSSIVQQIRDKEFEKDLDRRTSELEKHLQEKHALEMAAQEDKITLKTKQQYEKEIENQIKIIEELKTKQYKELEEQNKKINELKEEKAAEIEQLKDKLREAQEKNSKLQLEIESTSDKTRLAVLEAVKKVEDEKHELESSFNEKARDLENALTQEKEKGKILLEQKEKEVEFYKDLKTKMSTKMVGETLEQHCEIQFNQLRATAFRNAYFEKDNDARTGSKGDYIYRETDENGVEIISIMFEMKNEMDETATKHKNEDFFKELDKDRKEKNCEYAVLVSLLESDSELYNAGIVDVSYKYDKMYVVRPQCFIPMITLLRNAALGALSYKQELAAVRNQDIDISNFEDSLMKFKDDFSRNYEIAHKHFDTAIDEIDKTIQHLEKVKKELLGSDNQLRIANSKVDDVSVKKLTRNNPTMKAKFDELKEQK
ncbi:hypothetical protein SAMN04487928_13122 [Butyrivibrio proteoclasticus]|uniref:DUF2130 domain-containing protein n=1 Tax=Butyrivibrio proteoclasticus TaxID=43305 RepID=A0A1I5XES1_9FIRM|nr:DUF2130 domain-containing protein [Butyrivibrio proteoclasticus]SFQ30404.1 hypothetical protein SAMN04487928_13122 [Butyrivibrio proteoclasticus]